MPQIADSGCAIEWTTPRSFWNATAPDRKSTRLNSSHITISYAVFCLKKKKKKEKTHKTKKKKKKKQNKNNNTNKTKKRYKTTRKNQKKKTKEKNSVTHKYQSNTKLVT